MIWPRHHLQSARPKLVEASSGYMHRLTDLLDRMVGIAARYLEELLIGRLLRRKAPSDEEQADSQDDKAPADPTRKSNDPEVASTTGSAKSSRGERWKSGLSLALKLTQIKWPQQGPHC